MAGRWLIVVVAASLCAASSALSQETRAGNNTGEERSKPAPSTKPPAPPRPFGPSGSPPGGHFRTGPSGVLPSGAGRNPLDREEPTFRPSRQPADGVLKFDRLLRSRDGEPAIFRNSDKAAEPGDIGAARSVEPR